MSRRPAASPPSKRGRKTAVARTPARDLAIDVLVQSARWKAEPRAAAIVRKAIQTAAKAASTPRAELAIVLTDDSAIHELNRQWRGQDKPTNVLSFPAQRPHRGAGRGPVTLGDVIIAYQTTAKEARTEGKPLKHHLAHLAVHGFLHLIGYDHEADHEARRMESFETRILATLGVPDPYADGRT